jgi:hypothetical protein
MSCVKVRQTASSLSEPRGGEDGGFEFAELAFKLGRDSGLGLLAAAGVEVDGNEVGPLLVAADAVAGGFGGVGVEEDEPAEVLVGLVADGGVAEAVEEVEASLEPGGVDGAGVGGIAPEVEAGDEKVGEGHGPVASAQARSRRAIDGTDRTQMRRCRMRGIGPKVGWSVRR